jgi:hypothetical protein
MNSFANKFVGQQLIDELEGLIDRGESVLIMGPRFIGKRFLFEKTISQLQQQNRYIIVELSFLIQGSVITEEHFWNLLARKFSGALNTTINQEALRTDPAGEILRCSASTPKPLLLSVATIDFLPEPLARSLLRFLRTIVNDVSPDKANVAVLALVQ